MTQKNANQFANEGFEMTSFKSLLPKSGLVALVAVTAISSLSRAEIPFDKDRDLNADLRGQARASLCYAFAEEQLLKDFTCKRHCNYNANQWKYSIIDIARAHQEKWIKDMGRATIKVDLTRDLFANGASDVFPFDELGIKSVRSSNCTLESEIFFLNRSAITNPDRLVMQDYVTGLYSKLKTGPAIPIPQVDGAAIQPAVTMLTSIAHQATSPSDFLTGVANYTKCGDQVAIPQFKVQSKTISDPVEILKTISALLTQKKSLYVGVCAEILESEKDDGSDCGRHAVVLKNIRASKCATGHCGTEIQVVDSAFFSLRPKNIDGSYWIPASVVVKAMAKSAKDFERIQIKVRHDSESSSDNQLGQSIEDYIKLRVGSTARADFKAKVMSELNTFLAQFQSDPKTVKMFSKISEEVAQLKLESQADLDLIPAAVKKGVVAGLFDNMPAQAGNGIVWLEAR